MNNSLTLTTKHPEEVISLETVKSFLRINHTKDDALLLLLLNSAIQFCEEKLNYVIGKKEYQYKTYGANSIKIPIRPIKSIVSVFVNGEPVEYTFNNEVLVIKKNINGKHVIINFLAENLNPAPYILTAVLRHVFFLYENRSTNEYNMEKIEKIYNPFLQNNYNI